MRVERIAALAAVLGSIAQTAAPQTAVAQTATSSVTESGSVAESEAELIGDHGVLIDSLQSRLDVLAGRLATARNQVALLRDIALGGTVSETRSVILYLNELGDAFQIERASFVLDGAALLDKEDANGSLSDLESLILYDGKMNPGQHVLEVELVCKAGGFGVFSYVDAYRFKVTSRYVLETREGRTNRLAVVAHQNPDITLEAPKRLGIRYDFEVLEGAPVGEEAP